MLPLILVVAIGSYNVDTAVYLLQYSPMFDTQLDLDTELIANIPLLPLFTNPDPFTIYLIPLPVSSSLTNSFPVGSLTD